MQSDGTTVVVLDGLIGSLEPVQVRLSEVWRDHPSIDAADRMAFETALVELATNVVRYALCDEGAKGELRMSVVDAELRAQIVDNGHEFRGRLDQLAMPGPFAESGRGLVVIDALMDHFEYRRISTQNRWTIMRRLKMPVEKPSL